MIQAPHLPEEQKRLEVIDSLEFLTGQADKQLEDIASLTAKFCEVPIVLVSVVKKDIQEFYLNYGLEVQSTTREVSFCGHAIHQDHVFIVEDAQKDERFFDNPLVTGYPNVVFYAGYPLQIRGQKVGTLCMLDRKPRVLSPLQLEFHEVMGRQVEQILNQKAFMESYLDILHHFELGSSLLEENFSRFRDIINAISHDAIAPVRSIKSLIDLSRADRSIPVEDFLEEMDKSLSSSEIMLTNLLTWGINLAEQHSTAKTEVNLLELLDIISYELRQEIERKNNVLRYKGEATAWATDSNKLRFMLRNLIKNSNKFTSDGEISVTWETRAGQLLIEVKDTGMGMSPEKLEQINDNKAVEPGQGTSGEKGFGIGLKLIHGFANSLNGTLKVSTVLGEGTSCLLSFPLN